MKPLYESSLTSLPLLGRGKVRDIYAVGDDKLLIVTSDRLSAFDVILPDPIPGKGKVLTQLANFWFERLGHILPNQLTGIDPETVVTAAEREQVSGRSLVVKRLQPLPIEAVVRGYLIGSGWKDYQQTGAVCGIKLPAGLQLAARLPEPIFTPATKAEQGDHDENISFDRCAQIVGEDVATQLRDATLSIYKAAAEYAATRGIIIADTKFEFGIIDGQLTLIDECLTPDSSRFWPADGYEPGRVQPSYDKQYVRDWLKANWDMTGDAPHLPQEVIDGTSSRYQEAFQIINGSEFKPMKEN